MKIAFDENVPIGMVRVFQTLAKERQLRRAMGSFEAVSARDYAPAPIDGDFTKGSDVPWLERFAAAGGKVVISGDRSMLDVPHEMLALREGGFVSVFFERKWSGWNFFRKSSLLLHYWREIAHKIKTAKPGTSLIVPGHWREDGEIREISRSGEGISKIAPKRKRGSGGKMGARKKAEAGRAGRAERQGRLNLNGNGNGTDSKKG